MSPDTRVSLQVYNIRGQLVRSLFQDRPMHWGRHTVVWDGRDGRGIGMPSGMYVYQLSTPTYRQSKKMILLPLGRDDETHRLLPC